MAESKEGLPEEVAKRLADLDAENKALSERVQKAEAKATEDAAMVAKLLEDSAKAHALTVAKSMDRVGKVEDTAHLLFVAKRALSAEDYGKLEQTLKACDAQIKKGALFAVVGSDNDGQLASEFDSLVAKRMTEKKEDKGTATLAVMASPEGKQAYNAIRGGN